MALNFPPAATSGDTYLGDNGLTYLFDGYKWIAESNAVNFGAVNADIIPVANVTYSLGNVAYQWKDLYISNDTIYLSNIALSVNASGNLTVNGIVVASAELAELVSNAATQHSSIGNLIANAATQAVSISNLQSNAAAQESSITSLRSNAGVQSDAISLLQSNAGVQSDAIFALQANAGTQSSAISELQANAGTQSNEINELRANITAANAAIVTANAAVKSYVDTRITSLVNGAPAVLDTLNEIATSLGNDANLNTTLVNLIANVQSNVTGANSAIVTANTAMKSYVDAQIIIASNTGNITFTDTTISTTGTGTGIILNSAGDGEISMTDFVGIDNTNPGYWLHIGDANDSTGAAHRGNIALNYAHGVEWVDGVPPVASHGFRGTAVFDWRYWTTGSEGNYSKNGQAYREIGLFKDGLIDDKLFTVDLDSHVFSVNTITVDRHINAANITLTSNIVAPSFVFPSNPGGGGGDTASISYYATTGETTVLELSVANDADDIIKLNATGGVQVVGNITATSYVHGDGSKLTNLTYNQVGNIVGLSSNVTIAADSYSWTFDNTGNLIYPNGSRTKTAYKETIGYSNQVASGASGPATITNWTSSYTGTGGNVKVMLMFTAYGSTTGLRTFQLQRDSVTVANSSFYINTTSNHYPMLPLIYIDTSGSLTSHTYSIVIPSGITVDTNDFATITFTEF